MVNDVADMVEEDFAWTFVSVSRETRPRYRSLLNK